MCTCRKDAHLCQTTTKSNQFSSNCLFTKNLLVEWKKKWQKIYVWRKFRKRVNAICDQFSPPSSFVCALKIESIRWIDFSLSSIMKYHKTFHMRWQTFLPSFFFFFFFGGIDTRNENAVVIHLRTNVRMHTDRTKSKQYNTKQNKTRNINFDYFIGIIESMNLSIPSILMWFYLYVKVHWRKNMS